MDKGVLGIAQNSILRDALFIEDKMAFEELLQEISPKLKGIAHKLRGYCAFLGEDDLYQEAVARLWADYQRGKLADKTDSYILQGCYFYLRNYLRTKIQKAMIVSLSECLYDGTGNELSMESIISADPRCLVRDDAHTNAIIDQINNNGLTSREKEVFNLALSGLTTREIGSRLGISHVRVVMLRKQIRQKCRKHLDI